MIFFGVCMSALVQLFGGNCCVCVVGHWERRKGAGGGGWGQVLGSTISPLKKSWEFEPDC